jgi:signal transduction histidine kinase
VEVEPDEALPAVLADARRITQVVDNLLTNAARYSPTESPIVLRAHASNGCVQVEVVDHGRGIPPDKREHVFNRFVRLDEQPGGSGLGLAICRGIIEAHAGRIWVDSQVGRGSTFAFTLPKARAPTA